MVEMRSEARPGTTGRRLPLLLESLEQRLVLTVVFDPVFPKETLASAAPFTVLKSPTVYLDFWGSGWGPAGQQEPPVVKTLANDADALFGSTYFDALNEWGNVGTPVYGGVWTDPTDPPAGYDSGTGSAANFSAIQSEVASAIAHNPSWAPSGPSFTQSPIYVVIPVGNSGGYNQLGSYNSGSINICSVTGGILPSGSVPDLFTDVLSHELAEDITDPTGSNTLSGFSNGATFAFSTDATFPPYLANSGIVQIGDGEAEPGGESHYGYELNGVKGQALWSAETRDSSGGLGAYIVDDGNSESIYLDPIWTTGTIPNTSPAITGPVFTGNYNLRIVGDHQSSTPADDTITIDASDSQVNVGLDNQSFSFDKFADGGKIASILVEPGGGQNSTSVMNLAADQSVNIESGGADTVNLGTGFFLSSTQGIRGHVTVDGSSATTALTMDDSGDSAAHNFVVGTNGVDPSRGFVHETALPNFSLDFRYAATSSLRLFTGTASGNVVGVWQDAVPTTIWSYGFDTAVNVGNGNNGLDDLLVPLIIHGSGSESLAIDDRANPNPIPTLDTVTSSTVARNATDIFGHPRNATINFSGISSLELDTGALLNLVYVESTAVPTTVNAGAGNLLIDVSSQAENLDNIAGPLTVSGGGSGADRQRSKQPQLRDPDFVYRQRRVSHAKCDSGCSSASASCRTTPRSATAVSAAWCWTPRPSSTPSTSRARPSRPP